MVEKWSKIKGFDLYQISNFGHLRKYISVNRYKIEQGYVNKKGFKIFKMKGNDGTVYTKMQSRLVAESFIPNEENKWTVRHKDGNVSNCIFTNLYWGGPSHK